MPDDTHLEGPAPDSAAPDATRKKSAYPLSLTRAAVSRLEGILAGAVKAGTQAKFRGPIEFDYLTRLCKDFRDAEKDLERGQADGKQSGEDLRDYEGQAKAIVDATLTYVNIFYPHGTAGRARFYPTGSGSRPMDVQLAACIEGIREDRKQEQPLLPEDDPLLVVANAETVLHGLRHQGRRADEHEEGADAARTRRNVVGDKIREVVKAAEKFVRQYHQTSPEKLTLYGIRPLRHQIVPKP